MTAKRYVLYDVEGDRDPRIKIRKHSAHGLGHLINFDEKHQVGLWRDLLAVHYNPASRSVIMAKYERQVAVSRMTVSKASVHKRFATINKGKPYRKQIKPFNFIMVGTACQADPLTGKPIHPMVPYCTPSSRAFGSLAYQPFRDYRTGVVYPHDDSLDTREYWETLARVVESYGDHAEAKSMGETGLLTRRTIRIKPSGIRYIGKEANDIEVAMTIGVGGDAYVVYDDIGRFMRSLTPERARELGISRQRRYYWISLKR